MDYNRVWLELGIMAVEQMPLEACGFVCHLGHVIRLENISTRGNEEFDVRPEDVIAAWSQAENCGGLWAVWHSHPAGEAVLSGRDVRFLVPNLVNILLPIGSAPQLYDGDGRRLETPWSGLGSARE